MELMKAETGRSLMAMSTSSDRHEDEPIVELTKEQRDALIRKARAQLPELDRQFAEGMATLDRISRGLPVK